MRRSVENITSADRDVEVFCELASTQEDFKCGIKTAIPSFASHYISLHGLEINYQFLLDVLVSLLQNFLCSLQNCIFCLEVSNFLSVLLVHSPLAAQFPHQTFQL